MSESKTSLKLTKAGVVLSAEARAKLQRLADWMEQELIAPQDPRVRLSYFGGLANINGTTYMTPFAALVQMYAPFKLVEAKWLSHETMKVDSDVFMARVCQVLEITQASYYQLLGYIYDRYHFEDVIQALRTLK